MEKIVEVERDSLTFLKDQISHINKMVDIVNTETKKYIAMQTLSKEKMLLASEINSANIMILNKKFDLIMSHITDLYGRIDQLVEETNALAQVK